MIRAARFEFAAITFRTHNEKNDPRARNDRRRNDHRRVVRGGGVGDDVCALVTKVVKAQDLLEKISPVALIGLAIEVR